MEHKIYHFVETVVKRGKFNIYSTPLQALQYEVEGFSVNIFY
jgi:hypothetical protein